MVAALEPTLAGRKFLCPFDGNVLEITGEGVWNCSPYSPCHVWYRFGGGPNWQPGAWKMVRTR